jgi:hypothetical protein
MFRKQLLRSVFLSVHLLFHAVSALVGSCGRAIRTLQAREVVAFVCVFVCEREVGYYVRDIRTLEAREAAVFVCERERWGTVLVTSER